MPFWPTQSNEKASLIQRFKSSVQWLYTRIEDRQYTVIFPTTWETKFMCVHAYNMELIPGSPFPFLLKLTAVYIMLRLACSVRVATVANKNTPFVIPLIHVPKQVS